MKFFKSSAALASNPSCASHRTVRGWRSNRGYMFAMMLAMLALMAVMGVGLSRLMMTTKATTQMQRTQDNKQLMNSLVITLSSKAADSDGDFVLEPPAFVTAAIAGFTAPTNGGAVDTDVANTDAWGRRLGYCAYDYGSQPTAAITDRIRGSTDSSPTDSWVAVVVISAGPDGVINTTSCPAAGTVVSDVAATGDDMVAARSYGEMISFGNAQIASSLSAMGSSSANKLCRLNDSGKMVCDLFPEVPTGAIMAFFRSSAPPGWLECNGASISNSGDTAALYALIGGNLPDLRGEFIRGWDHGRGVDSSRGLGSWQGYSIEDHTHTLNRVLSNPSFNGDNVEQDQHGAPDGTRSNRIYETGGVSGASGETRPRNVAFLYAIKK